MIEMLQKICVRTSDFVDIWFPLLSLIFAGFLGFLNLLSR